MRKLVLLTTMLIGAAAQAQTIGTQIATGTYHEGMNVYLTGIDGKEVESGTSMWSDDENLSYPLSPGSHTLTLNVAAGSANEKMDAVIFATQGQQYMIGAETILDQQTNEPSSYIAWVQDSAGNRVWNQQFNLITRTEHIPSPWQH